LSTTVLSASTPKMVETQQEIHRLTKEYYTLKSEITNDGVSKCRTWHYKIFTEYDDVRAWWNN
jgi:hypothetical protein